MQLLRSKNHAEKITFGCPNCSSKNTIFSYSLSAYTSQTLTCLDCEVTIEF